MKLNSRIGSSRLEAYIAISLTAILIGALVVVLESPSFAQTSGTITQQWVDQKLVDWKPTALSPMTFGALLERASYDYILTSYNTPDVQSADLNLVLATGASSIRIDIGFDAWLQNKVSAQSELSSLVTQIRADGKSLVIADSAAESYRHGGQITWSQFKQAWVNRVSTLASLYHPDYYIVVKEPGWYAPMISDVLTNPAVQDPSEWLNLTKTLASTVHTVSPATTVGIAIAADSLYTSPSLYVPYLRGLANLSGISFIGFDLYTTTGFDETQSFLTQFGDQGKNVWIAECWSGDGSQIFDSSRSAVDADWVWAAYYFGQFEHAQMLIPFYTDLFASYTLTSSSPTDTSQIVSLYGQRTPVFRAYSDIVSGQGGPSTTQSGSTSSVSSSSSIVGSSTSSETGITTTSPGRGSFPIAYAAGGLLVVIIIGLLLVLSRRRK